MKVLSRLAVGAGFVLCVVVLVSAQSAAPPAARQMNVNGVELSYVDEGKGTPVVFVHGAVGDLRYWEPQRQATAGRRRYVAYTYRYHGTAPWPDDGKNYNWETHAADLAAFIAGLKAGPVDLVGLSYGGTLAAIVASKQPELVRTLTLAEPGLSSLIAESPEGKPALDAFGKGIEEVAAVMKSGDLIGAVKVLYALVTGEPRDNFDKLPEPSRQIFTDNARTLPLLLSGERAPIVTCDSLRAVKAPTLVVAGAQTPSFFSLIADAVVSCIPGSRLVTIPNANHVMNTQNPEAFNVELLTFLDKP
jgi:pimeloyl-ACP methyl ester carboxylesterase